MKIEQPFVPQHSIVKEIWSSSDHILLVFAGSAAEFAIHNQVDWLYFTGKLPHDPIKRLFSTVEYAAKIVFSSESKAKQAIAQINQIHSHVEINRGRQIPNWAYLDVLSMLIAYSIKSYEILNRQLIPKQKEELYTVFKNIALYMDLKDMPEHYTEWQNTREQNWDNNYSYTRYTKNLFAQYRKHLGWFRYWLLLQIQDQLLSSKPKNILGLKPQALAAPLLKIYKLLKYLKINQIAKYLLIPSAYRAPFKNLDRPV